MRFVTLSKLCSMSADNFLKRPHGANPLKLIGSFFTSKIAFQSTCSLPAFQNVHLLLEPWFCFLIRGHFDKSRGDEAQEEEEAREKILIECSPPDNEFSLTIQMYLWNAWVIHYSRFWSVTMDLRNEWWYLLADFISLILLIPLACVPLLIRKEGFPLINWWVSCSALSQISRLCYLSFPNRWLLWNWSCKSGWLW